MSKKLWEASISIKQKSNLFKFEKFLSKKFNYKINKNYNKLFKLAINSNMDQTTKDSLQNYIKQALTL